MPGTGTGRRKAAGLGSGAPLGRRQTYLRTTDGKAYVVDDNGFHIPASSSGSTEVKPRKRLNGFEAVKRSDLDQNGNAKEYSYSKTNERVRSRSVASSGAEPVGDNHDDRRKRVQRSKTPNLRDYGIDEGADEQEAYDNDADTEGQGADAMTGSAHQEMDVDLETSPDLADDGWNGAAFDPELDPQGPNSSATPAQQSVDPNPRTNSIASESQWKPEVRKGTGAFLMMMWSSGRGLKF